MRFDLNDQPPIGEPDDDLTWLEEEPERTDWSIENDEASPEQPLTVAALDRISLDLPLPKALRVFATRNELQRRVRSATACYLDVGQFRIPTSVGGGYLVHLLSDQQWVRHWLLYADREGNEAVVTTAQPLGFDLSADPDWPDPLPTVVAIDGQSASICAPTRSWSFCTDSGSRTNCSSRWQMGARRLL